MSGWDPVVPKDQIVVAPTGLDLLSSVVYAHQRLLYDKCAENRLGLKGIFWEQRDDLRSYRCPANMPDHPTLADDKHGVVGAGVGKDGRPAIKCFYGHCRFNQAGCADVGCYPYKAPDGGECRPGDSAMKASDGTPLCSPNCYDRFQQYKNRKDAAGAVISPPRPDVVYTEWQKAQGSALPATPSDGGKCIIGNQFFRRWCEFPKSRDTGCVPGKTNTVPFVYTKEDSTCRIPHDYCTNPGSAKCNSYSSGMDIDYRGGDRPKCSVPAGEEFVETFLTGKTIFRNLKEMYHPLLEESPTTQNLPMHGKSLLKKDYIEKGISLYLLQAGNHVVLGFDPNEVRRRYPHLVKGGGIISLSQVRNLRTPAERKIYLILANQDRFKGIFSRVLRLARQSKKSA